MSNIAVATRNLSPVEEFVERVLDRDRMDELARSLPNHIKPAMFQRNLLNAVMINPDLMEFLPGLLFREVSKAAALGLFLDPQLGEAYIVTAYNYKTKSTEPQLRVGYKGLIKLARQSGEIDQVYAHEVRENDFIECELGAEKHLVHKPKLFTDRGPVIGYYAVMKFPSGSFDFEPMDISQIHKIRDRSDAWKAYTEKKIRSTPWSTDEEEMAKKTVIRRLMKRAPQSPELAEAFRIEDAAEHAGVSPVRLVPTPPRPPAPPVPPKPPGGSKAPAIEHMPPMAIDTEPAKALDAAPQRASPPTAPRPPKPPAATKPPAAQQAQPAASDVLSKYRDAVATVTTGDELEALWNEIVEDHYDRLPPDVQEELIGVHRKRGRELEP